MARDVVATLDEAEEKIRKHEPFRLKTNPRQGGSTLRGVTEAPSWLGHLPAEHSEGIENAEYVVLSYQTPIAWVIDGEATVPDVGYSLTTSQHQYLAAHALGVPFRPARGRKVVWAGGGPRSGGMDDPRW